MSGLKAFLRDGRRAQRGGVLSGVLIMTAFIAIIAGALMTELSTTFLLSRNLTSRVATEATVDSAVELAFDSIQNAPLNSACPSLASVPMLNGKTSAAVYLGCALVVDRASLPAVKKIATSAPFTTDGTYSPQTNEYLTADSSGTLFAFSWGGQASSWTYALGGVPTAAPVAISSGTGALDLVPVGNAVMLLNETTGGVKPTSSCSMVTTTNATVVAQPAAGRNISNAIYFGDKSGTLYAFDQSCNRLSSASISSQPVVAGPIVFPGTISTADRLFVVVSDGNSSSLVQYRYRSNGQNFSFISTLSLPAVNAVGIGVDTNNVASSPRLAITFSGGQLALVQISTSYWMSLVSQTASAGGAVSKPPTWCTQCPGGALIGVGSQAGLYIFDANLNLKASYTGGGSTPAAPVADGAGDWFAASSAGKIYELLAPAQGTAMSLAYTFDDGGGQISSSPVMRACGSSLCVYFGATDSSAYLIPLDARDAVISACITNSQGSCSGANPRAWTQVEIGASGNSNAVRVQAFSYYSP